MEIHQLEYVVAVDRFKHFSKAAEEICLSQSTLSQQIRKLEEELGIQIFDRSTRNVHLTAAGAEFIVYAKRILSEIERAREAMLEHTSLGRGKIVIGAIPILGYLGLTSTIAAFQKTYPGIHLEIREECTDILIKWLQNAEIDLGLMTYVDNSALKQSIDFYPIREDEIVLITSQSHRLAKRKTVDLTETSDEKFVTIKSSNAAWSVCEQACKTAGFQPEVVFESSQVETICALVKEGIGVALLTLPIAQFMPRSGISVIHLKQSIKRTTAIAMPRLDHSPATVTAFREFVLQRFPLQNDLIHFE